MTARCELRYQDPRTLQWHDCPTKGTYERMVDYRVHFLCAEHNQQLTRVKQAGMTAGLRWVETPEAQPSRRRPVDPGQLTLEVVA